MTKLVSRAWSLAVGFAAWAGLAFWTSHTHGVIREPWDNAHYWRFAIPALLLFQFSRGALAAGSSWREPIWTIARHALALVLANKPQSSLALLPLALAFILAPLYGALVAADAAGQGARRLVSP